MSCLTLQCFPISYTVDPCEVAVPSSWLQSFTDFSWLGMGPTCSPLGCLGELQDLLPQLGTWAGEHHTPPKCQRPPSRHLWKDASPFHLPALLPCFLPHRRHCTPTCLPFVAGRIPLHPFVISRYSCGPRHWTAPPTHTHKHCNLWIFTIHGGFRNVTPSNFWFYCNSSIHLYFIYPFNSKDDLIEWEWELYHFLKNGYFWVTIELQKFEDEWIPRLTNNLRTLCFLKKLQIKKCQGNIPQESSVFLLGQRQTGRGKESQLQLFETKKER